MNGTVIVSLISFAGTLVGTLGGILTANHLTTYRLSQLEKRLKNTTASLSAPISLRAE